MTFKSIACGAVLAALVGASASAADLKGATKRPSAPPPEPDYVAPAPALAPIWQGLYWGVSLGYGWGDSEHRYDRNDNHGTAESELSGGVASVTVGYNYMWSPSLLVGIEGDLGLMDLSADDKIIFDGHVWKSEFGPFWGTLRARAGWLFGNTLVFATGGWAITEVNEVGIGDAAGQTATNESVRSGWVLGGGIEHAFSPNMTAKIEYLHMDFGRYEGYSENQEYYSFDNTIDLVRAGLNIKY